MREYPSVLALATIILLVSMGGPALIYATDDPTAPREFEFGGQVWRVKSSDTPVAPGPNYWSDSLDAIWLDEDGLHLTILEENGQWKSTEVFIKRPLGYGTYTFVIDSDIASYDKNVVAGFFTWDTQDAEYNREIDIEFAAWGQEGGSMGQYVVQPYTTGSERINIFHPRMQGTFSTHRLVWTPQQLEFSSYHGAVDPDDKGAGDFLMQRWVFEGTPPTSGRARFRVNLWLFQGLAPSIPRTDLTIRSFSFIPWSK